MNEHGYISEAQMLIRLLEHAGRGLARRGLGIHGVSQCRSMASRGLAAG